MGRRKPPEYRTAALWAAMTVGWWRWLAFVLPASSTLFSLIPYPLLREESPRLSEICFSKNSERLAGDRDSFRGCAFVYRCVGRIRDENEAVGMPFDSDQFGCCVTREKNLQKNSARNIFIEAAIAAALNRTCLRPCAFCCAGNFSYFFCLSSPLDKMPNVVHRQ